MQQRPDVLRNKLAPAPSSGWAGPGHTSSQHSEEQEDSLAFPRQSESCSEFRGGTEGRDWQGPPEGLGTGEG